MPPTPPAGQVEAEETVVTSHAPDTPPPIHDLEPQSAKYERGSWYYLVERTRPDGRKSQRWLPEISFDAVKIGSAAFMALRAEHLASLPTDKAALVATLAWFGEDYKVQGSAEDVM